MKVIDISGLSAIQAVSAIERATGLVVPTPEKRTLAQLADANDGYIESGKRLFDLEGHGDFRQRIFPDDSETFDQFTARMDREGQGKDWLDYVKDIGGKIPPYNGVVGDSHDCPSCNLRRENDGIDLMHDKEEGLTITEAKARVQYNYWKNGKEVPTEATAESGQARARMENLIRGALFGSQRDQANEIIKKTAPGAIRGLKKVLGDDTPLAANLEKVVKIVTVDRPLTEAERKEADDLLNPVVEAVLGAKF